MKCNLNTPENNVQRTLADNSLKNSRSVLYEKMFTFTIIIKPTSWKNEIPAFACQHGKDLEKYFSTRQIKRQPSLKMRTGSQLTFLPRRCTNGQ